jgi:hypothetical protein
MAPCQHFVTEGESLLPHALISVKGDNEIKVSIVYSVKDKKTTKEVELSTRQGCPSAHKRIIRVFAK